MKRNRFGLRHDPKTHHLILKRRRSGGVKVYEHQPCRRCGVSIRDNHCACELNWRKPKPPSPGRIFVAFRAKEHKA